MSSITVQPGSAFSNGCGPSPDCGIPVGTGDNLHEHRSEMESRCLRCRAAAFSAGVGQIWKLPLFSLERSMPVFCPE